jgi:hypothetical protein
MNPTTADPGNERLCDAEHGLGCNRCILSVPALTQDPDRRPRRLTVNARGRPAAPHRRRLNRRARRHNVNQHRAEHRDADEDTHQLPPCTTCHRPTIAHGRTSCRRSPARAKSRGHPIQQSLSQDPSSFPVNIHTGSRYRNRCARRQHQTARGPNSPSGRLLEGVKVRARPDASRRQRPALEPGVRPAGRRCSRRSTDRTRCAPGARTLS